MVYVQRYRAVFNVYGTYIHFNVYGTCMKTRFENGISHLVFLARYYHTNRTKSLRRLRNLSNNHKKGDVT